MGKVSLGAVVLKLRPSSEDELCAVVNVLRCGKGNVDEYSEMAHPIRHLPLQTGGNTLDSQQPQKAR